MKSPSPLRYPGGKAAFTNFFGKVLEKNGLDGGLYAEAFGGGAGAALGLLFQGYVDRVAINDADPRIFAFWKSALTNTTKFIKRIESTPLNIDEWTKQRAIYLNPNGKSALALGFSAFYLNRCNRSGILVNGGPIGGKHQSGKWKIDARFNKAQLIGRFEMMAEYGDRIQAFGADAKDFIAGIPKLAGADTHLLYLDPPYYEKGSLLYMNHFTGIDHSNLGALVKKLKLNWLMTYDDCSEIRDIYSWANYREFSLKYSAYESRKGGEILIWPVGMKIPDLQGSQKIAVK